MSRTFKSALSRRFLNLIAANHAPGVKSLHRIGLDRIFNSTTPGPIPNGDESESAAGQDYMVRPQPVQMDIIRLPKPVMNFRSSASFESKEWKLDIFPFSDCKVFCVDQSGRGFIFDTDAKSTVVSTVPHLHTPKVKPISLSIPQPDVDKDHDNKNWGSKLFILESMPEPEVNCGTQQNYQFEAFIYRLQEDYPRVLKYWYRHLVPPPPPPPFIRNQNSRLRVTSYAVIDGGSGICISIEGAGTYCMHTVSHIWNRVGEWTLPFHGKVEYVPELKLWFGTSAESGQLAAADLSAMDSQSQPQLVGTWKELDPPQGCKECKDSQIVNLGSGRFCIGRFFETKIVNVRSGDELLGQRFAVLTGVEVVNRGHNAEVELQMIPHKSGRVNTTTIETLF